MTLADIFEACRYITLADSALTWVYVKRLIQSVKKLIRLH